mgnify:CR=1 FL=1
MMTRPQHPTRTVSIWCMRAADTLLYTNVCAGLTVFACSSRTTAQHGCADVAGHTFWCGWACKGWYPIMGDPVLVVVDWHGCMRWFGSSSMNAAMQDVMLQYCCSGLAFKVA